MNRFQTLQGLRGFAAVSVMLMHCATMQGGLTSAHTHPAFFLIARTIASGGGAGVDIFFVISGFVITSVGLRTRVTRGRLAASADFLIRRILRVFPLYWVTLATLVALAAAFGTTQAELAPAWSWRVVMLVADQIPFQGPAWTLAFEMWFYAGTAVLIGLLPKRLFLFGLSAWAIAQALVLINPFLARHVPDFYAFRQPQLLDFFLGVAVAACLPRFVGRHWHLPAIALALSGAVFVAGCVRCFALLPTGSLTLWQRLAFYGLPAALLLYGLLMLERQRRIRTPVWLCRLGDWSYSIYLWHYPVMSATFVLAQWHPWWQFESPLLQAMLNVALTLAIAPLSFRLIERPFNELGKHVLAPASSELQSRS
jgi:peptidoglycan/LPS O-acetylase OafA/YrhL